MKKLLLGVAVSAAVFAGAANAVIVPALPVASVYTLTVSGASASHPYMVSYLNGTGVAPANRLCAGAVTTHTDALVPNQFAYSCLGNKALNPTLATAMGANVTLLIKKRTAGGSGFGVGPVATDTAIQFINGLARPDFGFSDLAPSVFDAAHPYNVDPLIPGLPLTLPGNLTNVGGATGFAAQVFGTVVNTSLRDALQNAQFPVANCKLAGAGVNGRESLACMPNLTIAQITQLIKRGGTTLAGGTIANSTVHTCGRTDGSGTKAVTALRICETLAGGNTPALSACQGIAAPYAASNAALEVPTTTRAGSRYHEMASASGVAECLSELNQGVNTLGTAFTMSGAPAPAIGYQSTDNNAFTTATIPGAGTTGQYRFIRVNGFEPTLARASAGTYTDVGRSTCQFNNTAAAAALHLPPAKKALITQICTIVGSPAVIAAVNPLVANQIFGQAGFLP